MEYLYDEFAFENIQQLKTDIDKTYCLQEKIAFDKNRYPDKYYKTQEQIKKAENKIKDIYLKNKKEIDFLSFNKTAQDFLDDEEKMLLKFVMDNRII